MDNLERCSVAFERAPRRSVNAIRLTILSPCKSCTNGLIGNKNSETLTRRLVVDERQEHFHGVNRIVSHRACALTNSVAHHGCRGSRTILQKYQFTGRRSSDYLLMAGNGFGMTSQPECYRIAVSENRF